MSQAFFRSLTEKFGSLDTTRKVKVSLLASAGAACGPGIVDEHVHVALHHVANRLLAHDRLAGDEEGNHGEQSGSTEVVESQMRARTILAAGQIVGWATGIGFTLAALPAVSAEVTTSEFLMHCEAAAEACKEKVLAYVKFLDDGGFLSRCTTRLPAADAAAELIGWMHDHPEAAGEDWVNSLDDAVAALKLCSP